MVQRTQAPETYFVRELDWFTPGRYLKIWAEEDREIHEKEFIILDAQNVGRRAIRVDRKPGQMPIGWGRTMIALDGPGNPSNRNPSISLGEWSLGGNGPKNRYVQLDRTYTLPCEKYACQDLGMLGLEGLQTLRQQYIEHLAKSWRIFDDVGKLVSTQHPPSAVTKGDTSSMAPNDALNKEGTVADSQGEANREPRERVTTSVRGRELDIKEVGITREQIEDVPEEAKEDLMIGRLFETRPASEGAEVRTGGDPVEMTIESSNALPPSPQSELLAFKTKNTYRDENSDEEDTSSVFSLDSIASSATSVSDSGTSSHLLDFIRVIAVKLFNSDALYRLSAAAVEDDDIDEEKLRRNLGRMVRIFGKDLKSETNDASERSVAHAMQIRSVATHAAREVVLHFDTSRSKRPSKPDHPLAASRDEKHDEESEAEIESASEDDSEIESTGENDGDLARTHDFLLSSNAYVAFKRGLLDFVHAPYRRRVLKALGEVVTDESGAQHGAAYLSGLSRELSWVPIDLFRFSSPSDASLLDTLKNTIEQALGEQWQWWPSEAPNRPLKVGWVRLHWQSVSLWFTSAASPA